MRRMSFSLTTPQMRARTKTETRRLGWENLKPGEHLIAIEKGMGLKKGEKHVLIGEIEVDVVERVRLDRITKEQVKAEGFPEMEAMDFILFFCRTHNCMPHTPVTRIRFRHVRGLP